MRKVTGRVVTAAIYRTETGPDLRLTYGTDHNIVETLTSGVDDAPLLARAAEVRQRLKELGWHPVESAGSSWS
jgi:hypothetical protein